MIDAGDLQTGPPPPQVIEEVVEIPPPPPLPSENPAPLRRPCLGYVVSAPGLEPRTYACPRCGTWEAAREPPCSCWDDAWAHMKLIATRRLEARITATDGRLLARRTPAGEKAEKEPDEGEEDGDAS